MSDDYFIVVGIPIRVFNFEETIGFLACEDEQLNVERE